VPVETSQSTFPNERHQRSGSETRQADHPDRGGRSRPARALKLILRPLLQPAFGGQRRGRPQLLKEQAIDLVTPGTSSSRASKERSSCRTSSAITSTWRSS